MLNRDNVSTDFLLLMDWMTCKGRQMIEHTKKLVEDKFTTLNGKEHNAEV